MDIWHEIILPRLQHLTAMEYFTFAVNALVYCFSKSIASHYGEIKDEAKMRARLRVLHGFNLTVFITFVVSLTIKNDRFPADRPSSSASRHPS